jgi:hypothetical protein
VIDDDPQELAAFERLLRSRRYGAYYCCGQNASGGIPV